MSIVLKNKNVRELSTPSVVLHLKNTTEPYTLQGPREACEDTVCPCTGENNYKQCKMTCIDESSDKIVQCCEESCGENNPGCYQACRERMIFS
jgi:hypothetical protein